jgi:hypothetical protein
MSAGHDDRLTAAAQRTHRTEAATPVVLAAVEQAEMDPALAHLDELPT